MHPLYYLKIKFCHFLAPYTNKLFAQRMEGNKLEKN